jgi:hypothetical protein
MLVEKMYSHQDCESPFTNHHPIHYIFNLLRALVTLQRRHDTVKKGHALLSSKLSGLQARHAKAAKRIVMVGFEHSSGPVYWHICPTDYLVETSNKASPRRGNDNTH